MPDKVVATGQTSVILVVNMKQFIAHTHVRRFESVRGTSDFARVLQDDWAQKLQHTPQFIRTEDAPPLAGGDPKHMPADETGFVTGIFRYGMLEDYSAPEYMLVKGKDIEDDFGDDLLRTNYQFRRLFIPIWKQWDIFIRPTVTGMFVIRLVRAYPRTATLHQMAREVIDLQTSFDIQGALDQFGKVDERYGGDKTKIESVYALLKWLGIDPNNPPGLGYVPVQWQLAMEICHRFIAAFGASIDMKDHGNGRIQLQQSRHGAAQRLHDSYVIYHLDEVLTKFVPGDAPDRLALVDHPRILSPREIKGVDIAPMEAEGRIMAEVRQRLVNLLEGAMLYRRRDKPPEPGEIRRYFPVHNPKVIADIFARDLATWEDELCLFTSRTAVIIPSRRARPDTLYISTLPATQTTSVMYPHYWDALKRMIEFITEIHVLAQLLERSSSGIMQHFVHTLRDLRGDMLSGYLDIDRYELTGLVEESANVIRLLGLCQSLSNPHVWSRAEYATDKAEHLLKELKVARLLEHAERNVTSLTSLVNHVDELYLAELSERSNRRTVWLSVVLAAVSLSIILFSLPSFWKDSQELNDHIVGSLIRDTLVPFVTNLGTILGPMITLFSLVIVIVGLAAFIIRAIRGTIIRLRRWWRTRALTGD